MSGPHDCPSDDFGDLRDDGVSEAAQSVHGAAEGIDFAEGDGSHSGALEAETESADSGEKIEDIHGYPFILYGRSSWRG